MMLSISTKLEGRSSASEPDLATAGDKVWRSGFPPGTTVDELRFYRRRRPPSTDDKQDHLKLEEGSFKDILSEYKKKFRYYGFLGGSCHELNSEREDASPVRATAREDEGSKLDGAHELHTEHNESFIGRPGETSLRSSSGLIAPHGQDNEDTAASVRQAAGLSTRREPTSRQRRRHLFRKPTNLKLEGELNLLTETAEKFIQYLFARRPNLIRRSTSLRLEGDMDTRTETSEQFAQLDYQKRPPLCKKFTNLHLEGELEIATENRERFKPLELQPRPPLSRHSSTLHLEGELDLLPEYRKQFIDYKIRERPKLTVPANNLNPDGSYTDISNESKLFGQRIQSPIPFLRSGVDDCITAARSRRNETTPKVTPRLIVSKSDSYLNHQEEKVDTKTDRRFKKTHYYKAPDNLALEGSIELNPEYKNSYVNFSQSIPDIKSKKTPQRGHLRSEGRMEINPEYRSSYVTFPRTRPSVRKPDGHLSSEGTRALSTEQLDQFVPHENVARRDTLKREPGLKLEGPFECQPEYRKAYIDYLTRERIEKKGRPVDNLHTQSRKAHVLLSSSDSQDRRAGAKELRPAERSSTPTRIPIRLPPRISSSSTSSIPPSPRPKKSHRSGEPATARTRPLSHIESSVFGPKLAVPASHCYSSSSRSSSPARMRAAKTESRRTARLPKDEYSPRGRPPRRRLWKSGSPVRVENLARAPALPPPPLFDVSTRRRWMRDDSLDSSPNAALAFVVLGKEINNNDKHVVSRNNQQQMSRGGGNSMPSWCIPP